MQRMVHIYYVTEASKTKTMSKQLTLSAAAAIMTMSLFVLTANMSGSAPEQLRAPVLAAPFTALKR